VRPQLAWRLLAAIAGTGAVTLPIAAARLATARAEDSLSERVAYAVAGYVALVTPAAPGRPGYEPRQLLVTARGLRTLPGWSAPVDVYAVRTPLLAAGGPGLPSATWRDLQRLESPVRLGAGTLVPLKDREAWDVVGAAWVGRRSAPRDRRPVWTGLAVALAALGGVWAVGRGRGLRRVTMATFAAAALVHGGMCAAVVRGAAAWSGDRALRDIRTLIGDAPARLPVVRSRVPLAQLARVVQGTGVTLAEADSAQGTMIRRVETARGPRAVAPIRLGRRRWLSATMVPLEARQGGWTLAALGLALVGVVGVAVAGWGAVAAASPRRLGEIVTAWAFLGPAALHLVVFSFGPMLFAAWLSLHEWDLLDPVRRFVGLRNFAAAAADPLAWVSLRNTLLYTLYVPVTMMLALGVALVLQHHGGLTRLARTVFFMPYVASVVAVALVWQWMLSPDFGLVNWVLGAVGVPAVDWLGDPHTALLAVMVISTWVQLGYQTTIFVAGLQNIPQVYHDAARVDGANAWQRFWRVTLPLLRPVTLFVLVTGVIGSFQVFTYIYVLTDGGPLHATDVIVYRIYQTAWEFLQFGHASALALALFVILLGVTWVQFRLLGRRVEYG